MVELYLLTHDQPHDENRMQRAIDAFDHWYLGDGGYGDGMFLAHDYYNSITIQPMLIDLLEGLASIRGAEHPMLPAVRERFVRYAQVQERMIGPDGSYPPIGRSLAYRCGVFQHLAQAVLQDRLPEDLPAGQVREAMTAMISRTLDPAGTFDENGWLHIGVVGHQPSVGEDYISRGSGYLCTNAFLPMGLPVSHPFWANPPRDWTAKRLWAGEDVPADHAMWDPRPKPSGRLVPRVMRKLNQFAERWS